MTFASDTSSKFDSAQAEIDRLRSQVDALMKDRVIPAVAEFAGRAEGMVHDARGAVRDKAEAVSHQVRQQPLVALLIAAALGWIIGRAMR
jgi:ElaB/YqjD/DUF883 family membrane-anchored ribosome-binding protein